MTAPILMPCPAALLRPGICVYHAVGFGDVVDADAVEEMPAVVTHLWMRLDGDRGERVGDVTVYGEVGPDRGDVGTEERDPAALSVDLRDPSIRDRLARAIWAKLRPKEPEPITAPTFACYSPSARCWTLRIDGRASEMFSHLGGKAVGAVVPALADIPLDSPDRDLLALRAVALVVLA